MNLTLKGPAAWVGIAVFVVGTVWLRAPEPADLSASRDVIALGLVPNASARIAELANDPDSIGPLSKDSSRSIIEQLPLDVAIHDIRAWRIAGKVAGAVGLNQRFIAEVDATIDDDTQSIYLALEGSPDNAQPVCKMGTQGYYLARYLGYWKRQSSCNRVYDRLFGSG